MIRQALEIRNGFGFDNVVIYRANRREAKKNNWPA